jgi:hypothetical protein
MAEYCSLEDAFRDWVSPVPTGRETALPVGGCTDDKASRAQRREEKRRAKRCKGPVAKYIETQIQPTDPDRLIPRMELVEAMVNKGEDYLQNPDAQEAEALRTRGTLELTPGPTAVMTKRTPAFFGANFDLEEPYAPFIAEDKDDSLGPDFMSAFKDAGLQPATTSGAFKQLGTAKSSTPALTIPSVSNFWKPMTPAGADTAFYQALPAPGGTYPSSKMVEDGTAVITNDALQRRLKKIYERLDELEVGQQHESASSETVLFVLSGVFVLFALDLVSKLGR